MRRRNLARGLRRRVAGDRPLDGRRRPDQPLRTIRRGRPRRRARAVRRAQPSDAALENAASRVTNASVRSSRPRLDGHGGDVAEDMCNDDRRRVVSAGSDAARCRNREHAGPRRRRCEASTSIVIATRGDASRWVVSASRAATNGPRRSIPRCSASSRSMPTTGSRRASRSSSTTSTPPSRSSTPATSPARPPPTRTLGRSSRTPTPRSIGANSQRRHRTG